jgi:hypothetical protein
MHARSPRELLWERVKVPLPLRSPQRTAGSIAPRE